MNKPVADNKNVVTQKNAIVLGMPRSGTSLTAAIFARQGYFLASGGEDDLRPGDFHNPSGYFEAAGLVERNATLFRRAGFDAHNSWLFHAISDNQVEAIGRLAPSPSDLSFIREYSRNTPWLWKDPRLCYTLRYWWPLLDPESTRVLLVRRKPEETWNSFLCLDWRQNTALDRADVYHRIDHHLTSALDTIREMEIPHEVINYDDFSTDPAGAVEKINACFGMALQDSDLGFDKRLNSTTLPRRLGTFIRKQKSQIGGLIPKGVKVDPVISRG